MKFKMFVKMMAVILTLLMCINILPAYAYIYSPGAVEYELDTSCLLESNNVTLSNGNIVFSAGGSIKFDLLLPFDSYSITFECETILTNTQISIITDEKSYVTTLRPGETTKQVLITELYGSNTIAFTANKAVTITDITFNKINENYNEKNSADIPLTEYEYATLTSVIFKDDAAVLKARGALQRLDIENICLTPMNIDGRLYVPFGRLAEALGYYSEDYPDKAYIYMAGETDSLAMVRGTGYVESDKDGRRDLALDVTYIEGVTWVPVRKLAEALGFSVEYKDGFVVIDDRLSAKKVVENKDFLAELTDEFSTFIPTEVVSGKTYHVAQNAQNHSSSGTLEAPFLTIQEAADVAKAGDTVIVHKGTYRETVTFDKNDGTALNPITFKAAGDGDVVISALDKLSGFAEYEGKILKASVPEDLGFGRNQLFYKGEALNQGRHPNGDTKEGVVSYPKGVPEGLYATKGNISITAPNSNIAYSDTDLNQEEADYWKGGTFVTLKGEGWNLVSGEITASSKGQLTLKDHDGTKSYNLGLTLPEGSESKFFTKVYDTDYGYITNHINTVDIEGEWFMDNNVMYVIPPKGANLETDFEVKQRQLCIDLRGRKYITIDGIDTIGGGITMAGDDTEGCILNNGEFKYIAHHTVLLDQSRYSMTADESKDSLKSVKAGEVGICLDGKQNAIVNSVIDYSSASAIYVLGKYHYINNNIISNSSYSGGSPGAVTVSVDVSKKEAAADEVFGGHFITHNTISNAGRSLISFSSTVNDVVLAASPVEVAYNRLYNGILTARDAGLTYEYGFTGGNDKSKTRLHHNFVYNPGYKADEPGSTLAMIYHDGYSAARDTYCNVTYYEEQDKAPTDQVFVYSSEYTVTRNRNNAELGYMPNGEGELLRSDFPGGRWFEPGCNHDEYVRSMRNYNDFKEGNVSYYPCIVSSDSKTYTFENVEIEADEYTALSLYMTRDAGVSGEFDVTAKLYDQSGSLVKTVSTKNTAQTERFYVYENHRGMVVIPPISNADTYDVEIVFGDATIDLQRLATESFDGKYDNLYTEEMENGGTKAYLPVSSVESDGEETVTFENVQIEGGEKTILDLHMLREFGKQTGVLISAEVYDSGNNPVANKLLPNTLAHSQYCTYEALSGIVVIPELAQSGNYKVVIKLSDTYSQPLRLITKKASAEYDSIFNENVILGGSYDEWIRNSGEGADITKKANLAPDRIKNYNYYSVNGCYEPTLIYKNRVIKEDATVLRYTFASEGSYVGSTVSLYVDSLANEPIATWNIDKDTRWKPETEYILLNSTLTAGTHTFYFKFSGKNGKCSNLYNFSFDNGANQVVNLFADFENMSVGTGYTEKNITDKTNVPLTFGRSYYDTYNISGEIIKEDDGNQMLKLIPTQEAETIKSIFTLDNALEIGKVEMGYEFAPDSNRPQDSAWSMFYYGNETDTTERIVKFMDTWQIFNEKVTGKIYAQPGKNSKGRYCFKSVISRYDVNDNWEVRILDMSGNSPKLFFKGTIHRSFGNIKNLNMFNLYTGRSGWPGSFDNYFINVYDFLEHDFNNFTE